MEDVMASNRCGGFVKWLRRWRTTIPKFVIPALVIENILTGKKPHDLLPPEISVPAVVGLLSILAGTSIRIWARGHFIKGRLFTTGPYEIVRHPLYIGTFLITAGFLFILNDWLNWFIVIPFFIVFYGTAVVGEERAVKRKFGCEWESYRARVPMFMPLGTKTRFEDVERWDFTAFLKSREHYTVLLIITAVALLEVIEEYLF